MAPRQKEWSTQEIGAVTGYLRRRRAGGHHEIFRSKSSVLEFTGDRHDFNEWLASTITPGGRDRALQWLRSRRFKLGAVPEQTMAQDAMSTPDLADSLARRYKRLPKAQRAEKLAALADRLGVDLSQ